jgi:hypothetical protein
MEVEQILLAFISASVYVRVATLKDIFNSVVKHHHHHGNSEYVYQLIESSTVLNLAQYFYLIHFLIVFLH